MAVQLSWTDNSNNETGFEIQRDLQSGTTWINNVRFTTAANVITYTDSAVAPASTYRYAVRSFNAVGPSAWTSYVQVSIPDVIPAAPTGLSAVVI